MPAKTADERRRQRDALQATAAAADSAATRIAQQFGLDDDEGVALRRLLVDAAQPQIERDWVFEDPLLDLGSISTRPELFTIKPPTLREGPLVIRLDPSKVVALVGAAFKGDAFKLGKAAGAALKDAWVRAVVGPETLASVVLRWVGAQDFTLVEAQVLHELCVSVDHDGTRALPQGHLLANLNAQRELVRLAPLERTAFDAALRVLEVLKFAALDPPGHVRLAQAVIPWQGPFDRLERN